jgi:hypothetical protein
MVKEELVAKYGLPTVLPEHLALLLRKFEARKYREATRTSRPTSAAREGDADDMVFLEDELPPPRVFPLEDLELTDEERKDEGPRPTGDREFLVPMELVTDVLAVWDFCHTFS